MSRGLVIVVTGANGCVTCISCVLVDALTFYPVASGVGFGICHRLLVQLSYPNPPDARPFFHVNPQDAVDRPSTSGILDEYTFDPKAGVTIIMACRDPRRAQDAQAQLYRLLDQHIAKFKPGSDEKRHATTFREGVKLELEMLDLASVQSVFDFGKRVTQKCVGQFPHLEYVWTCLQVRVHLTPHIQRRHRDV